MKYKSQIYPNKVIFQLALLVFIFLIVFNSCKKKDTKDQKIFQSISSQESGITFKNQIKEDKLLNILNYEYLYNGSGVAIGDINNDGLPDIFLGSNFGDDKLYLNLGNLKFKDISQAAQITHSGFTTGVAMVDINADGWLDIYVCRSLMSDTTLRKNILYINNGDQTFTESADKYGLASTNFSNMAYFYDAENDGDLDMYLCNNPVDFSDVNSFQNADSFKNISLDSVTQQKEGVDIFFENQNGLFKNKTQEKGFTSNANYGLSAALMDVNHDGYQDLYVCNDYMTKDMCYVHQKEGHYVDSLSSYFTIISKNSMGSDYNDLNNDGLSELMVLDMQAEDMVRQRSLHVLETFDKFHEAARVGLYYQLAKNVLQINLGNKKYAEAASLLGMSNTDWSWSPLLVDMDNNGFKDILISNGILRNNNSLDWAKYLSDIYKNKNSQWNEDSIFKALQNVSSTPVHNYCFENKGNWNIIDKSIEWGWEQPTFSQGMAYGDLDRDGDLDIIFNNANSEALLYKNLSREKNNNNYLQVNLKGPLKNTFGLGTQVYIFTKSGMQVQTQNPYRGYFSSQEPILHFGIGQDSIIDRLTIVWNGNKTKTYTNINVNQTITLAYEENLPVTPLSLKGNNFFEILSNSNFDKSNETNYIDYKKEPLLSTMYSRKGPYIISADINSDKRDDILIGGGKGEATKIYLQNADATWTKFRNNLIESDSMYDDMSIATGDIDADGDIDICIASGGYQYPRSSVMYHDRIYINDGKGDFKTRILLEDSSATSDLVLLDYDNDKDLDILASGYVLPQSYPLNARTFLWENKNPSYFINRSDILPNKGDLGLINDLELIKNNADKTTKILIAAEWQPIRILQCDDQKFTIKDIDENITGKWLSVKSADIDNDGDMDIIAGNVGTNTFYKPLQNHPAEILAADFDSNGSLDAFPVFYDTLHQIRVLKHTLEEAYRQLPLLRERFQSFTKYAESDVKDIFSKKELQKIYHGVASTYSHILFYNDKNIYTAQVLPILSQISPCTDVCILDIDQDGLQDIMLLGNDYYPEADIGRQASNFVQVLKNNGNHTFTYLLPYQHGFYNNLEHRKITKFTNALTQKTNYIFSNRGEKPVLFQLR